MAVVYDIYAIIRKVNSELLCQYNKILIYKGAYDISLQSHVNYSLYKFNNYLT